MARTAISELERQIEEVRREAFAAGYAAGMEAIRELASRSGPDPRITAPRRRSGAASKATPATPTRRRRARVSEAAARPRRPVARRPQRSNAQLIEDILRASAPRALRQAEIRKALRDKGIELAFTSIRHALAQLEARNAAEQVGDSRTWQAGGAAS